MRKIKYLALSVLMAATPVSQASAATVTTNLNVKITITNGCSVETPSDLDFGSEDLLDANIDEQTTLSVTCTNQAAYKVGLSAGTGSGATESVRKMTGGSETVSYGLYRDAARTLVWGDIAGTNFYSGTGNGDAQSLSIYGRVPPQVTPSARDYTDTVTVTVSF
ncbi:MAG: spore coat U domain-containing protein [Rhizobiaceae bacterium]|nr:spore coat U domain-containing protein [Rhizobiaceae bacterium]